MNEERNQFLTDLGNRMDVYAAEQNALNAYREYVDSVGRLNELRDALGVEQTNKGYFQAKRGACLPKAELGDVEEKKLSKKQLQDDSYQKYIEDNLAFPITKGSEEYLAYNYPEIMYGNANPVSVRDFRAKPLQLSRSVGSSNPEMNISPELTSGRTLIAPVDNNAEIVNSMINYAEQNNFRDNDPMLVSDEQVAQTQQVEPAPQFSYQPGSYSFKPIYRGLMTRTDRRIANDRARRFEDFYGSSQQRYDNPDAYEAAKQNYMATGIDRNIEERMKGADRKDRLYRANRFERRGYDPSVYAYSTNPMQPVPTENVVEEEVAEESAPKAEVISSQPAETAATTGAKTSGTSTGTKTPKVKEEVVTNGSSTGTATYPYTNNEPASEAERKAAEKTYTIGTTQYPAMTPEAAVRNFMRDEIFQNSNGGYNYDDLQGLTDLQVVQLYQKIFGNKGVTVDGKTYYPSANGVGQLTSGSANNPAKAQYGGSVDDLMSQYSLLNKKDKELFLSKLGLR